MTTARPDLTAAALTATLGLAAASWVVCAAGARDRRTRNPDRHRALVGSRPDATDVRRHRYCAPSKLL